MCDPSYSLEGQSRLANLNNQLETTVTPRLNATKSLKFPYQLSGFLCSNINLLKKNLLGFLNCQWNYPSWNCNNFSLFRDQIQYWACWVRKFLINVICWHPCQSEKIKQIFLKYQKEINWPNRWAYLLRHGFHRCILCGVLCLRMLHTELEQPLEVAGWLTGAITTRHHAWKDTCISVRAGLTHCGPGTAYRWLSVRLQ